MTSLQKVLREPLLHFLVLGAGLFVLFGVVGGPTERAAGPDRGDRSQDRESGPAVRADLAPAADPGRNSTA